MLMYFHIHFSPKNRRWKKSFCFIETTEGFGDDIVSVSWGLCSKVPQAFMVSQLGGQKAVRGSAPGLLTCRWCSPPLLWSHPLSSMSLCVQKSPFCKDTLRLDRVTLLASFNSIPSVKTWPSSKAPPQVPGTSRTPTCLWAEPTIQRITRLSCCSGLCAPLRWFGVGFPPALPSPTWVINIRVCARTPFGLPWSGILNVVGCPSLIFPGQLYFRLGGCLGVVVL